MTHKTNTQKLKIALFSTPWIAVPPPKYGGTELVVYNLAEGLVRLGHDVTIFTTGDSLTSAKIDYVHARAGYRAQVAWGNKIFSLLHSAYCFQKIQAGDFDLVHNHYGIWGISFAKLLDIPCVTTYHGDLTHAHEKPDIQFVKQLFAGANFISISRSQARYAKLKMRWVANVYNGIEVEQFEFNDQPQDYFVWLGRFTPDKGAKEAILAARRAGVKLIMAGKIDQFVPADVEYYEKEVKPLIDGKQVKYIGEIGHRQKVSLLKNARALMDTMKWNEPFGLVMTEAMACGTPVIATRHGSVPEIVADNQTGIITSDRLRDVVAAIKRIHQIDRLACRRRVEQLFSDRVMTKGYEQVYYKLMTKK